MKCKLKIATENLISSEKENRQPPQEVRFLFYSCASRRNCNSERSSERRQEKQEKKDKEREKNEVLAALEPCALPRYAPG